jgi:hypothetical protein
MQDIFTLPVPNTKDETKMIEDCKMSMKFRDDIEPYTEEELEDSGVPIKNSQVLRILIKWIEDL